MNQTIVASPTITTRTTIAQDYQRGWEIAQKEYKRQQKQDGRKQSYHCQSRSTNREIYRFSANPFPET